jgi:hypothetical protein
MVAVRAAVMMTSARSAPEMGPFTPSMRQPPFTRSARVSMPAKSEPAPGSDIARANRFSPLTIPGR